MTLALLGSLVVLALVDSTSFGTLLIPIWLMLAPGRLRPGRIVVFVATVGAFYLLLGLVLVAGLAAFSDQISAAMDTTPVLVLQVSIGVVLAGAGVLIGTRARAGGDGRLLRWRELAVGEDGTTRGLMLLAITSALIEAASMVPYLAGIGLIGTADLAWPLTVLTLSGYCVVMVLPALLLLAGRMMAEGVIGPLLQRINDWMTRTGRENTAWVLGLIGLVLAVTGLDALGVIDVIDG